MTYCKNFEKQKRIIRSIY